MKRNFALCWGTSPYRTEAAETLLNAAGEPANDKSVEIGDLEAFEGSRNRVRGVWSYLDLRKALLFSFALWGLISAGISIARGIRELLSTFPPSVTYDAEFAAHYTTPPCYCGESTAEALSLGCVYDDLSSGWLPAHCRDDDLTAEFHTHGDGPDNNSWLYWADAEHRIPLTLEQVSEYADHQPHNYHMSREWHRWHCLYLWLKEHRAKANGKIYDPISDTEHHIRHCWKMLMEETNGTSAGVFLSG